MWFRYKILKAGTLACPSRRPAYMLVYYKNNNKRYFSSIMDFPSIKFAKHESLGFYHE